jgi:hypothetical protein
MYIGRNDSGAISLGYAIQWYDCLRLEIDKQLEGVLTSCGEVCKSASASIGTHDPDNRAAGQTSYLMSFPSTPSRRHTRVQELRTPQSTQPAPDDRGAKNLTAPSELKSGLCDHYLRHANAAAAPSSVSNNPAMLKSEQEKYPIYNGRPANRRGPPIAIYHTAFAQLKDSLQDLNKVVDPQELKRVDDTAKLILASAQIYRTEKERTSNVYPYICSLLWIKLCGNVATTTDGKKKAESDGLVEQDLDDKTLGETVAIVGHVEAKNEPGVAGQCGVQNTLGLRKFLANDKVRRPHNYADVRN